MKIKLQDVIDLYEKYCLIYRRNISYSKYNALGKEFSDLVSNKKSDSLLLRESLLEHVGNLPVVAIFLYPYLEHREEIDLGKVLTMLAIHDIGELVVGDEHPHKKTDEHIDKEKDAALGLLHTNYHDMFCEYEDRNTLEAKFAKSVDVFSTFLSDQILPKNLVKERFRIHDFSWRVIEEKRYEIFAWDSFLKDLFVEVVERYKAIEG
jgi:5'-deoxynucleotidase YfbR-like HD superfamily hydrolase